MLKASPTKAAKNSLTKGGGHMHRASGSGDDAPEPVFRPPEYLKTFQSLMSMETGLLCLLSLCGASSVFLTLKVVLHVASEAVACVYHVAVIS